MGRAACDGEKDEVSYNAKTNEIWERFLKVSDKDVILPQVQTEVKRRCIVKQ